MERCRRRKSGGRRPFAGGLSEQHLGWLSRGRRVPGRVSAAAGLNTVRNARGHALVDGRGGQDDQCSNAESASK